MAADRRANTVIAEEVGVTPVTVRARRKDFAFDGLVGLGKVREGRAANPRSARRPSPRSSG